MQLNFKSFGSGTPVIILHGFLGSLDNWQTFARRLSSAFQVYTLDLRNHGKSPHSEEHSYEAMTSDLLEFFEEHQIQQAHIIGHSMGGKVAMQFAIAHPEKVFKLIVVDIAPRALEGTHDEILDALMDLDLSKIIRREEADELLAKRIYDSGVRQFLLKNLDRNAEGGLSWKMNLNGLHRNYENINAPILSSHPVNIPMTVIRGGKSDYVKDGDMSDFKKIFPGAQLITILNSGHWVHADAPDEFYNAVKRTLN